MEYIKNLYDEINNSFFESDFSVYGTLFIKGDSVTRDSIFETIGDSFDARVDDTIIKSYPEHLRENYRLKFFIIDKGGLWKGNVRFEYGTVGHAEPYDIWIACKRKDVQTLNNKTLFDYSEYVKLEGIKYNISGIMYDNFGNDSIVFVFLTKVE